MLGEQDTPIEHIPDTTSTWPRRHQHKHGQRHPPRGPSRIATHPDPNVLPEKVQGTLQLKPRVSYASTETELREPRHDVHRWVEVCQG